MFGFLASKSLIAASTNSRFGISAAQWLQNVSSFVWPNAGAVRAVVAATTPAARMCRMRLLLRGACYCSVHGAPVHGQRFDIAMPASAVAMARLRRQAPQALLPHGLVRGS